MNPQGLTQEYLKKILYYDPLTGIFTWLERPISIFMPGKHQLRACNTWNTRCANKEAGSVKTPKERKTFYVTIKITLNGKSRLYKAHRLAILYTEGQFPLEDVDHIDGNGLNNRRSNLREVSNQENHKNRSMNSTNTSGHVGVIWHKPTKKWLAKITVNGKSIHGGLFINKIDAITKRKQLEIEFDFHENHGRK